MERLTRLSNPQSAAQLFDGWQETPVWSALEGAMGCIWALNEQPKAALCQNGDFLFLAGTADEPQTRALLEAWQAEKDGFEILVPRDENCGALITGESLGQVASQTLHALGCTDECASMPVFRPCIGMDKNEIVEISRKIDTFEISIRPYEDCCTVFTPKHPRTRATKELARQAEEMIPNREELIERAIASAAFKNIN